MQRPGGWRAPELACAVAIVLILVAACVTVFVVGDGGDDELGGGNASSRFVTVGSSLDTDPEPSDANAVLPLRESTELCSSIGTMRIRFPGPVTVDGPRELRTIQLPTKGTFVWGYDRDEELRFDAYLVDHAEETGGDARFRLLSVLQRINDDPGAVHIGDVETVGDHVEADFTEEFDGRHYRGRAFARDGVVVAITAAWFPDSGAPIVRALKTKDAMLRSLDFPGLDDPSSDGDCPDD